jgi:hypothetical protein
LLLAGAAAAIIVSGYALYYTTDRLQYVAAAIHEFLGGTAILFALAHWWGYGRRRARG